MYCYLVVFDELIDGVETNVVDEVILCTSSFRLGVNTTVVVLAISTGYTHTHTDTQTHTHTDTHTHIAIIGL